MEKLISINEASKLLSISKVSLRRYSEDYIKPVYTEGGHRRYKLSDILKLQGVIETKEEQPVVIYCRVSTSDQKNKGDLTQQKERLVDYCVTNKLKIEYIFEEVGSGLNDNRKKLRELFNLVSTNKVSKVIIEHKDRLAIKGKRLNSYIITDSYVQFCFEIDTGKKKEGINAIGIDTGIKALASLNNGAQFGLDTESLIERIKRCQHGSKGQKQARRAFKQRIDEVVQQIVKEFKNIDLVVVEALKNMNFKSKLKRRLSKNMRRSIGTWAYRYWLKRLEQACETNRVSFRSVAPYYTSQTCPSCGHVDRGNRVGQIFRCLKCGHTGNADIIAARNILTRFLTGLYGARYKPYEVGFFQV